VAQDRLLRDKASFLCSKPVRDAEGRAKLFQIHVRPVVVKVEWKRKKPYQ
jgi:hypothetical protein